ncbi:hypothetical protein [Halosimplex halophilum]|uniref:hypothetical protein n=1 Tax=Halosimplex halophilum TaxID=2559572 RepID=UPI00107F224E|nr:hypothetical protein [Halosimplex halophilum]
MESERSPSDQSRGLGGLLVAFVFVGLPVGSAAAAVAGPAGYPFGLSTSETVLVAGAVPIALAEATDNRPDAARSVAFFAAFVVTQLPALLVVELAFEAVLPSSLDQLFALLAAYVLAFQWGPAGTARRCRRALGRLTWVPEREKPADRR